MKKEEVIEILNKQIDMYKHAIELDKRDAACSSGDGCRWDALINECEVAIDALKFVRDVKLAAVAEETDDHHAELINAYVKERIENDIGLGIGVKQRILEFFDEAAGAFKKPSVADEATHDYIIVKSTIIEQSKFANGLTTASYKKESVGILTDVTASKAIKVLEEVEQRESDSHVQYSLERLDQ